ncbi:hypothetical protein PRZ48_008862 [Zasmidium cellare]|uniref:RNase H type-1 domain-containing protein n=1 Tax=Zasmidium cellare TaxID=395010 RepID=A0ABR0EHJ8_ZASCE|nr:hypothetical protein PRZ48_008862 [Zasmidium cellare]
MASSGVIGMWTDGSVFPHSDHGGAAFTFKQSADHWAGQWCALRSVQSDIDAVELRAIKEAVDFVVSSARRLLSEKLKVNVLPTPRKVAIITDSQDALVELKMFWPGAPTPQGLDSSRVTQVIHTDLVSEIARLIGEAEALNVLIGLRWWKRATSSGSHVADQKAWMAANQAFRQAGRSKALQTESRVFAGQTFHQATCTNLEAGWVAR